MVCSILISIFRVLKTLDESIVLEEVAMVVDVGNPIR
jgi:hypothetical protein